MTDTTSVDLAVRSSPRAHTASAYRTLHVTLGLALLVFLTRAPFLTQGVINWDESTFILVGQDLLQGHLPYEHLWDNKSPLTFAFFAAVISTLGKDIVAIRIAGMLCVLMAAVQTYAIGLRLWRPSQAVLAAALFVLATAAIDAGQATMSEHVALPFLLGATLLLMRDEQKPWSLAAVGALLGIATLVRLNLAFVAVAVGCWILGSSLHRSVTAALHRATYYALGGISILVITALPYVLAGQLHTFVYSVFEAPLVYSQSMFGPLGVAVRMAYRAAGLHRGVSLLNPVMWIGLSIWAVACLGFIATVRPVLFSWREHTREACLLAVTVGVAVSIVLGGAVLAHYLIQLLPFGCLLAARIYTAVTSRWASRIAVTLLVCAAAGMSVSFGSAYVMAAKQLWVDGRVSRGPAYEIAEFLESRCDSRCSLYMLSDHLVYWLLDKTPPTKIVTHPSNITKRYMLRKEIGAAPTPEGEMLRILATAPTFIVKDAETWYLKGTEAEAVLESCLSREYELASTIEGRQIWRRRERS